MDISYRFTFASGLQESIAVSIDSETALQSGLPEVDACPDWSRLAAAKCPHCTLDPETQTICPAAYSLLNVVRAFKDVDSHETVNLLVEMPDRTVFQKTSLQRALGSLVGLLLATSGCPHLGYFRPMARFHLPLSSEEDTFMRAAGMYLLGTFLSGQGDKRLELSLDGLKDIYHNLGIINNHMARRLRQAARNDASVNALILLDMFVKNMPYLIEDKLGNLRPLFSSYLDESSLQVGQ